MTTAHFYPPQTLMRARRQFDVVIYQGLLALRRFDQVQNSTVSRITRVRVLRGATARRSAGKPLYTD